MNKKELIKSYEAACFAITSVSTVLEDLKQLDDEKEKVTLPRPVANWISCVRGRNKTLHFALENAPEEVNLWFCEDEKNRQNIFADAWVNGYHIERVKRYTVKLKNTNDYLNETEVGFHFYDNCRDNGKFTQKEIEEAGFGWVFDCPGIEVEEVEE